MIGRAFICIRRKALKRWYATACNGIFGIAEHAKDKDKDKDKDKNKDKKERERKALPLFPSLSLCFSAVKPVQKAKDGWPVFFRRCRHSQDKIFFRLCCSSPDNPSEVRCDFIFLAAGEKHFAFPAAEPGFIYPKFPAEQEGHSFGRGAYPVLPFLHSRQRYTSFFPKRRLR